MIIKTNFAYKTFGIFHENFSKRDVFYYIFSKCPTPINTFRSVTVQVQLNLEFQVLQ